MELPGEKLIIRIWETLSEKGIDAIFKPSQVRRKGVANIEIRQAEMLVLAQAEREVKEIQSMWTDLFSTKEVNLSPFVLGMGTRSVQDPSVTEKTINSELDDR